MKKKAVWLVVLTAIVICFSLPAQAEINWSFDLEGAVSNKDAWTRLQASLDWKLNLDWKRDSSIWENHILFHVSPDIGFGTENWYTVDLANYYTTDLKNWSGRNWNRRSMFTARELYAEAVFGLVNAGYGLKIFESGAVSEITPLDINPADFLDLNNPRVMSQVSKWLGLYYHNFSLLYVKALAGEGKVPLDENNHWRPKSFPYKFRDGTHGGGCLIE